MIKVYGKTVCGACETVKAYLKSNGLVEGEHFDYINIDESEKHTKYINDNYMSVPITEFGGKAVIGFEVDELNQMIEDVKR